MGEIKGMLRHRDPATRDKSIFWARGILARKHRYVLLDTETTGLSGYDVIVQTAIIDLEGKELLNSLVRPTRIKRIPRDATAVHGIEMSDLENAPTFAELIPQIKEIISGKTVLIYNAEFDERLIGQTCEQDECSHLIMRSECVMIPYSRYVGRWSDYHSSFPCI